MLSAHTLEIAAIAVPYFGLMAGLCGYMAWQVRHRDEDERDDTRLDDDGERQDEPGGLLLAA